MSLEQPMGYPRGEDLPDSDGVPLDSDVVVDQTRLYLIDPLRSHFQATGTRAFVSGDSFVYYDPNQPAIGPDFYVILGAAWRSQKKWVAYEEGGLLPTTVIEFLSPSTEENDRGRKFCIYRDTFRTREYFLIDQDTLFIEGYRLHKGHYVAMSPRSDGWYDIPSLGLQLGPLEGWIRLRTPAGSLLLTGRELAEQERLRAEQERLRAEQERRRREVLEARLRELGIDPESLS